MTKHVNTIAHKYGTLQSSSKEVETNHGKELEKMMKLVE